MIRKATVQQTISPTKKRCLYGCNESKLSKEHVLDLEELISSLQGVKTKSRWCLGTAVKHLGAADGGRIAKLIVENGVPESFRFDDITSTKPDTFRSLVKIVTGNILNYHFN